MDEHINWRPDVHKPRNYPPPQREDECDALGNAVRSSGDQRDEIDREALRRCVLEFEAAAYRLRLILESLGG